MPGVPAYLGGLFAAKHAWGGQFVNDYTVPGSGSSNGLNLLNSERYSLTDESLIKVGTATEDFLNGSPSTATAGKAPALDLRYQRGQVRAEREAWPPAGPERWSPTQQPDALRCAKPPRRGFTKDAA